MNKKEWLQALLDGKTMTSIWSDGSPIIFYEGTFIYKDTSEAVNLNLHNHGLREYFKYPMWFKDKTRNYVVKFTSLNEGSIVQATELYKIGYSSDEWQPHTNCCWVQVDEPITIKEITMEELEIHYGCKIKIIERQP